MANNEAITVQEPNDLSDDYLTDETASRTAVLVYTQNNTSAGIKKIGIAPWKRYLGFDSKLVHNLAKLVGFQRSDYDASGEDIPSPTFTLKGVVNSICQQLGISYSETPAPSQSILTRTSNLEKSVNGYDDEEVHHNGLLERMSSAETNISSLSEEIGSSSGGSGTLTQRISSLESNDSTQDTKISVLESYVGNDTNGLVKDVATLKSEVETTTTGLIDVVGNSSSGLVKDVSDLKNTVNDSTTGLVKKVTDNTSDISSLKTTVGNGTSGLVGTVGDSTRGLVKDVSDLKTSVGNSSSGLVKDVSDLKNTVGNNTVGSESGLCLSVKNVQTDVQTLQTKVGDDTPQSETGLFASIATINNKWKRLKGGELLIRELGANNTYLCVFTKNNKTLCCIMSIASEQLTPLVLNQTADTTVDDFYEYSSDDNDYAMSTNANLKAIRL